MAKTINQKVVFKNTTTDVLYDLYMNSKKHAMISGAPAIISAKPGSNFSAHNGYIKGKNLHLVKDKTIVQTWRGSDWNDNDPDSVFIINLEQKDKDVVMYVTHSIVPDKKYESIAQGWKDHYWNPWKQHLAGKKITRPAM